MKDPGKTDVIFGIKITLTEREFLWINLTMLRRSHWKYNYFDSKPASASYYSNIKLFKNIEDDVKITYVYVVGLLCKSKSRQSKKHIHAIGSVMRCLKIPWI